MGFQDMDSLELDVDEFISGDEPWSYGLYKIYYMLREPNLDGTAKVGAVEKAKEAADTMFQSVEIATDSEEEPGQSMVRYYRPMSKEENPDWHHRSSV